MGNDRESENQNALEDMTGHSEKTRREPLPVSHYYNRLKQDYNLGRLLRTKEITDNDLLFIAKVQAEIDKYSYTLNIDFLSPDALFGACAVIGAEEKTLGLYIRRRYEDLTSLIHMCKKDKQ